MMTIVLFDLASFLACARLTGVRALGGANPMNTIKLPLVYLVSCSGAIIWLSTLAAMVQP
jgi:hypothetical protein